MNKKLLIGVGSVIALLVAVIAFLAIKDIRQESVLKEEIKKIEKMNVSKDKIDMKIYTQGDYGVVEKTIKEYLNDYVSTLQDTQSTMEDKTIINMLGIENYKTDGPEFKKSLKHIKETKEKLNKNFDKMIALASEDAVMEAIEKKKVGKKYVNLYKECMISNMTKTQFKKANKEMEQARDIMIKLLDIETEVLNFLKDNKNHWELKSNTILFDSTSLLTKYNSYSTKMSVLSLK